MKEDYFVLTFSQNCDLESVHNAMQVLQITFPDKDIIALPEMISLRDYSKKELIKHLKAMPFTFDKLYDFDNSQVSVGGIEFNSINEDYFSGE